MDNGALARLFDELADLLEIAGENPFKTRAYRAFAQTAREHAEPLAVLAARGELEALPGVGRAIATKVDAALHTGGFPALDRARAAVPEPVRRLLEVPGLGPKLVRVLWKEGGVASLGELAYACEENRLGKLAGFGGKKQARLLDAVRGLLDRGEGALLATAVEAARAIAGLLVEAGAAEVVPVGETRRGLELVRELVVHARGITPASVVAALDGKDALEGGRARASTDGATMMVHGLPVRVRAIPPAAWVYSLVVGTGDERHVAFLGEKAGGDLLGACTKAKTEESLYRALGVPFVPAELRDRDPREAERVPAALVDRADVRGFFHVHTDWSDGIAPILAMARAASSRGYRYVGISDHSRAASYANGLDAERLREQAHAVAVARRESTGCAILHGVEVDVLPDGSLDLDDETLASLDFVIASVHSKFTMTEAEMTARVVRAVSHPLVTILGHPTGRLLLGRRGATFDLDAVARAAAANDTYLEINANAQRLDLSDAMVRRAAALGASFAIDPDAHADHAVDDTELGVLVARRAGLTRDRVLNARDRDEVMAVLAARKEKALARLAK